jgi:hypothetical protein
MLVATDFLVDQPPFSWRNFSTWWLFGLPPQNRLRRLTETDAPLQTSFTIALQFALVLAINSETNIWKYFIFYYCNQKSFCFLGPVNCQKRLPACRQSFWMPIHNDQVIRVMTQCVLHNDLWGQICSCMYVLVYFTVFFLEFWDGEAEAMWYDQCELELAVEWTLVNCRTTWGIVYVSLIFHLSKFYYLKKIVYVVR